MKTISFFGGVVAALILAFCGSVLFAALTPLFNSVWALKSIISLLTLAYLLYLLGSSPVRIGRVTAFSVAAVVIALSMYCETSLVLYALLHIGLIWLVRSCYFHNSLAAALADMGLCGLGFAAALWAVERSGTLFLALWSFFLVQALVLPVVHNRFSTGKNTVVDDNESFRRAYRSAQSALRRFTN
jgi:hypothetical protein